MYDANDPSADACKKADPLWPDSVCPMLYAGNAGMDAATYYRMTKQEISNWCREGCSVECGRLLQEKMEKKRSKRSKT